MAYDFSLTAPSVCFQFLHMLHNRCCCVHFVLCKALTHTEDLVLSNVTMHTLTCTQFILFWRAARNVIVLTVILVSWLRL